MSRSEYLPFGRPSFGEGEIQAVSDVLRTAWVGMGPQTIQFEKELAQYLGDSGVEVVTVNSCTSALFLSLLAAGVQPGDEVIVPSLTWCSTANAILYLGATPVFCDVDSRSFCVTPETLQARLSAKTKAVLPVHYGGLAADICGMRKMLPENVIIIEDAAHAMGSFFPDGTRVGTSSNLTCFSFYANKNLSTGEGGAVALKNSEQADLIRSLRQHGLNVDAWKRFSHSRFILSGDISILGYKMNYTDLQASLGRVQLRRLEQMQQSRQKIVFSYLQWLKNHPEIQFQQGLGTASHAAHLFVIQLPEKGISRDDLILKLREQNIGASIHYHPLHTMSLYSNFNKVSLPVTDMLASRILTLPISASMTEADAEYVCETLEVALS